MQDHFSFPDRFRSLADIFVSRGQQVVCFNYNERESLVKSAYMLTAVIVALSDVLPRARISLIGHGLGGLVARRALIEEQAGWLEAKKLRVSLTTISAPFGGVEAAAHCDSDVLTLFSLGLVKPICRMIVGGKYKEIFPAADFIRNPGTLASIVGRHLKIMTDETSTCRRHYDNGVCAKDDYVFSLDEQIQKTVDEDPRVMPLIIKTGHLEIVGDANAEPERLAMILQQRGVLRKAVLADRKNDAVPLLSEVQPDNP